MVLEVGITPTFGKENGDSEGEGSNSWGSE